MLLGFVCVEFCGANVHCDKAQFACGEVFKAFVCTTWGTFFLVMFKIPLGQLVHIYMSGRGHGQDCGSVVCDKGKLALVG